MGAGSLLAFFLAGDSATNVEFG